MPDLYLQGILIQDMEGTISQLERAVLNSVVPTTMVDMTRLVVKQTLLFPQYRELHSQYQKWLMCRKDDETAFRPDAEWKKQVVFHRTDTIAPMVQTLLDETRKVPTRLREAYVRQWHRALIKRGLALIKYVQEEGYRVEDMATRIIDALALDGWEDLSIVLTQAEKLKPGTIDIVSAYSKRL
ncbi:hypothetical protein DFQ30_002373 [Apophysomyces sp. BC1015]|nr:hypothetical protein DFQ30_002373 [Apophysomyces sp. BC1015]